MSAILVPRLISSSTRSLGTRLRCLRAFQVNTHLPQKIVAVASDQRNTVYTAFISLSETYHFPCRNLIILSWLYFAAWWRGVHLSVSDWHSMSTPLANRISATEINPHCAAIWMGASPFMFTWLRTTPLSINSWTVSLFPPRQARCSGVFFLISVTSSRFALSSVIRVWILTTSIWPCWQAVCSGVRPLMSLHSISWGSWSINCCTTLHWYKMNSY